MTTDEDQPVRRGGGVPVIGEDLGPLSAEELTARIAMLEAEIARVRAHAEASAARRREADALFGSR